MHPGKRFYVAVFKEKKEVDGIEMLAESAVPAILEEVPDSNDWRPTLHQWYRFLTRKPTQPHDPAALHTFLASVRAKHPESDTVLLEVVDWYCPKLWAGGIVYQSPLLVERYGPTRLRIRRIKQGSVSFHECYAFLKQLVTVETPTHHAKLLRLDDRTLDSVTLVGYFSDRYFCTIHTVTESQPYVKPPTQSSWWGEIFSFD